MDGKHDLAGVNSLVSEPEQQEPFDLSMKKSASISNATKLDREREKNLKLEESNDTTKRDEDSIADDDSSYCDVTSVFTDHDPEDDDVTNKNQHGSKLQGTASDWPREKRDDVTAIRPKMALNFGIDNILNSHPSSRIFLENFQRYQQNLQNAQQEALRRMTGEKKYRTQGCKQFNMYPTFLHVHVHVVYMYMYAV